MSYEIEPTGLKEFDRLLQTLGQSVEPAASFAINETAVFARRVGSQAIRNRINFKANYLQERLAITKRAKPADLEGVVTGRDRPTSLARFAQGTPRFGRQRSAPRVRVKAAGAARPIRNGFFMRLRRGNTGELGNVGIAVRLKPGETVPGKRVQPKASKSGLALLYGPSVGQAFRSAAPRAAGPTSDRVVQSLLREFDRMMR